MDTNRTDGDAATNGEQPADASGSMGVAPEAEGAAAVVADEETVVVAVDLDGDGATDVLMVDTIVDVDDAGLGDAAAVMEPGLDMGGAGDEAVTGTSDVVYNLVSVLYHALQGAEITTAYADDADFTGDEELAAFFAAVQAQDIERAERAKALLRRYL